MFRTINPLRRSGWIFHSVPLAGLLALVSWYFLHYVPTQRTYLEKRNFKALALASQQLKRTIESLPKALDVAAQKCAEMESPKFPANETKDPGNVGVLMPLVELIGKPNVVSRNLSQETPDAVTCSFFPSNKDGRAWLQMERTGPTPRSPLYTVAISGRSDLDVLLDPVPEFDGLVLAEDGGRLLMERLPPGLNITDASVFLTAASKDKPERPDDASTVSASRRRTLQLGGSVFEVFVQPVRIDVPMHKEQDALWILYGLADQGRFHNEAQSFDESYWLYALYASAFLALAVQFISLLWGDSQARIRRASLWLLAATWLVILGVLPIAAGAFFTVLSWDRDVKTSLEKLSEAVDCNFQDELQLLHGNMTTFNDYMTTNVRTGQPPEVSSQVNLFDCDPWKSKVGQLYPHFRSVSWIQPNNGVQVGKWTTRSISSPLLDLSKRSYFRDARDRAHTNYHIRLHLSGDPQDVWLEPIHTYYSGESSAVLCAPLDDFVVTSEGPLLSVTQPVFPPGFGFCVVDKNGMVHFHSEAGRALRENLFDETDRDARLRLLVATRGSDHLSDVPYRGTHHRMYASPLAGTTWTLVVFRDGSVFGALHYIISSSALLLLACHFVALFAFAAMCLYLISSRRSADPGAGWNETLDKLRPDSALAYRYRCTALFNCLVAAFVFVALFAVPATRLGWLVCFGAAGALAGFLSTLWFLVIRPHPAADPELGPSPHNSTPAAYGYTLASLFLLLSILPSLVCFRIAHDLALRYHVRSTLYESSSSLINRSLRLLGEDRGFDLNPAQAVPEAESVLEKKLRFQKKSSSGLPFDVYLDPLFSRNIVSSPSAGPAAPAGPARIPPFEQCLQAVLRLSKPVYAGARGRLPLVLFENQGGGWHIREGADGHVVQEHLHALSQRTLHSEGCIPNLKHDRRFVWGILVLCALLSFAVHRAALLILGKLMLDNTTLPALPRIRDWVVGTDSRNLLVLVSRADQNRSLASRLGLKPSRAQNFRRGTAVYDLREGIPDWNVIASEQRMIIDGFDWRWDDQDFNLQKLALLERILLQGGITVMLVSSVHPDHFALPKPPIAETHSPPSEGAGSGDARLRLARILQKLAIGYVDPPLAEDSQGARSHRILWATFSRAEQLLLVHVARNGWIGPRNKHIQPLLARGILVRQRGPKIASAAFRSFLQEASQWQDIRTYEENKAVTRWSRIRFSLLMLLVGGLVILALARPKDYALFLTIVPAVAGVVPVAQRLLALGSGPSKPAGSNAA